MTDDKTLEYLEEQRDELVDQNFIGAEEAQLRNSPYYKLGQRRKKKVKEDSPETLLSNIAFGKMLDEKYKRYRKKNRSITRNNLLYT